MWKVSPNKEMSNTKNVGTDLNSHNYFRLVLGEMQDYVRHLAIGTNNPGISQGTAQQIIDKMQNVKDSGLDITKIKNCQAINVLHDIEKKYSNTEKAFKQADKYLQSNEFYPADEALHACGVVNGRVAAEWFNDYFVTDRSEGLKKAKDIKNELENVDVNTLYVSNPDFHFGYDFTPEHIKKANSNDICRGFGDAINSLRQ